MTVDLQTATTTTSHDHGSQTHEESHAQAQTQGLGYDAQSAALSPTASHTTQPHMDQSRMGIFLVGWTSGQVNELFSGMAAYAGIRCNFNAATFEMTFSGEDRARMAARKAEGRWSQGMHEAWKAALVGAPRHSVVIGAQKGDTDLVRGGYAGPDAMVLDMLDIGTFAGETTRAEESFNIYWVMTHELLGHFYLGLGHGEGYKSYDINTYDYSKDETLIQMNEWRMEMGLPVRLQHPPRVEGAKRTYIFVDAYPGQPTIDVNATEPDPNVKLPPLADRKRRFAELRGKIQNQLSRPDSVDVQFYPEVHFTDDDSDAQGNALPGRGSVLPNLSWGSRRDEVRLAQQKLNEHGAGIASDGKALDEDAIFGRLTHKATRGFQGTHGCQVDGIIGPETWSALLGYQVMTREQYRARRKGERHAHNHNHA